MLKKCFRDYKDKKFLREHAPWVSRAFCTHSVPPVHHRDDATAQKLSSQPALSKVL